MSHACKNCDAPLDAGQGYCAQCGQAAATHRLTFHEIAHEFIHAMAHVDRSVFSLVRLLLLRPGVVSRDYVDGRRRRYFGPFAFLTITVGLATALVALSGVQLVISPTTSAIANGVQHHVNLLFLAQVPLLAAYSRLLFYRQRFNLAETLVPAAYTTSMRTFLFVVIIVPTFHFARLTETHALDTYYAYSLVWLVYYGFACSQFYAGRRSVAWLKGSLAAILTQTTVHLLINAMATLEELLHRST